jgi:type IV pilus assembly protein PilZ
MSTASAPLTAASPLTAGPSAPRPSVIQLAIKEKAALYAAYIPLFTEGGMFIPTARDYKLGDDVYVLLTLPEDPQRYPVAGKVAWVTPARAAGNRTQGVGIRFPVDDKSKQLKLKIEALLGAHLASDRPTQTI